MTFEFIPFHFHQFLFVGVKAPDGLVKRYIVRWVLFLYMYLEIILPYSCRAAWTEGAEERVIRTWLFGCELLRFLDRKRTNVWAVRFGLIDAECSSALYKEYLA